MHTYTLSNFALVGKAGRGQIVISEQPKWQRHTLQWILNGKNVQLED